MNFKIPRRISRRHLPWWALAIVLVVAVAQQAGWIETGSNKQSPQSAVLTNQPGMYAIDHFIDGDTIAVNMNGKVESIRMIGVDTPETHKPNSPVQCYGVAAAAYTKTLIANGRVRLASDSLSSDRDRYNRLLRYVYLPDGRLLQEELIKNGYGFAYTSFPFGKSGQFTADQQAAKDNNKGLWGNCQTYQESSGRWQTNDVSG